jgi:hypothetical protein
MAALIGGPALLPCDIFFSYSAQAKLSLSSSTVHSHSDQRPLHLNTTLPAWGKVSYAFRLALVKMA